MKALANRLGRLDGAAWRVNCAHTSQSEQDYQVMRAAVKSGKLAINGTVIN